MGEVTDGYLAQRITGYTERRAQTGVYKGQQLRALAMLTAPQAAVELEAWREELEAVLASPLFRHAPSLAQLLSYLCEKRFSGDTSQVKEYSIGVEVFHRGEDFDQETDSIVRVGVNRLRKRLAEYYAGDGASHRLQITIPVGQYVPEFRAVQEPASSPTELVRAPARHKKRPLWIWIAAVLALLVVGSAGFWFWQRRSQPAPAVSRAAAPASSADMLVGLPPGDEVRILAGSTRSLVDHAGKLWSADLHFTGGTATRNEARRIVRTQDPGFYRASREGQFRYDIPLRPGVYELQLHFAETVYGAENNGVGGEGSRLLTVRANGKALLEHFDVFADAGGGQIADVRVFPDIRPDRDGQLHLEFAGESGKAATLSAIAILPGVPGRMRPVRVLARATPYYSNDSEWWSPDDYFEGGQLASYTEPVNGTDDPELYETERWGNFSYAIPAAPGRYAVVLHFAARRQWNEGQPESGQREHVFNVFCNGRAVLANFDLAREAQHGDVVIRRVTGLAPNAQGKILLTFVPVRGYATVTGIEVLPQ
jgi:malectin (di-glucose binding ER protein)